MRIALIVLALAGLTGCVGNLPDLVHELASDPATVCAKITTPYGSVSVSRTNAESADITCQDGNLNVRSQASQIGVPVLVVPKVSIGPPVVAP